MTDTTIPVITVRVILALPSRQTELELTVPANCTARQAVQRAVAEGLPVREAGLDPATVAIGVFGRIVDDSAILNMADRVELYRPLQQDPKERRRSRAQSQD